MIDVAVMARLIPSIIETIAFVLLLYSYSEVNKNLQLAIMNAILLALMFYMYGQEFGILIPIITMYINSKIIFKNTNIQTVTFITVVILISIVVQSITFVIYSQLFSYDVLTASIPAVISIVIEVILINRIILKKGKEHMTLYFWIGKKTKVNLKQYKKTVKK